MALDIVAPFQAVQARRAGLLRGLAIICPGSAQLRDGCGQTLPVCSQKQHVRQAFNLLQAGIIVIQEVTQGFRPTQLSSSGGDRKSTRLNSSHVRISYAVFCLKKKTKKNSLQRFKKLSITRTL